MSVFTNRASRSAEQARDYTAAILALVGGRAPMDVLRHTPDAVRSTVAGLTESQLSAPEASGKWSIRQVVRHLADSDLVWGYRMRMVLAHDRPPLTGYDQDLWAERLRYDRADVEQALQELAVLRRSNLGLEVLSHRLLTGGQEVRRSGVVLLLKFADPNRRQPAVTRRTSAGNAGRPVRAERAAGTQS